MLNCTFVTNFRFQIVVVLSGITDDTTPDSSPDTSEYTQHLPLALSRLLSQQEFKHSTIRGGYFPAVADRGSYFVGPPLLTFALAEHVMGGA